MTEAFAGVDLGGTSVKLALANENGKLLCGDSIPTEGHLGPKDIIGRIGAELKKLAESKTASISAIGVGAPGLIDVENGITKFLPNLPGQWRDIPMAAELSDLLSCPVKIANDARTATLGELKFGHGKQNPNATLVFFTLGTGVGGGVAIDGKLRLGPLGAAGEIGHQTILANGLRCGCGNRGCLETIASGPAIECEGIRLMKSGLAPNLHALVDGDPSRVSVSQMMMAFDQDDAIAEAITGAATYIGIAAANIVTILHPDMIVFGGGVAEIGNLLIDTVKNTITERVGMFPTENVQILKSLLGTQAGVVGAIALALEIANK